MKTRIVSGTLGIALAVVFLPLWATAEELSPIGTWTGTIKLPKKSRVTYEVKKGPEITMHWANDKYPFNDLDLKEGSSPEGGDTLTFNFDFDDSKYQCNLKRKPKKRKFEGDCTSTNRKTMHLSMSHK